MTYLKIDEDKRRIFVRFADGKGRWVPVSEIEDSEPPVQLDLKKVELPNPYEINVGTKDGEKITIPWDFIRHYCDKEHQVKEERKAKQGREILANRLFNFRKEAGLTQVELARKAGIGRATLSRLENGEHSPRYETLEKIAKALGVKVSSLLVT